MLSNQDVAFTGVYADITAMCFVILLPGKEYGGPFVARILTVKPLLFCI